MSKTIKKTIKVSSIRRAAGKIGANGQRALGNILVNGLWFSSQELRNCFIGVGLDPNMPLLVLQGATFVYDEITVTPEDLVANPLGVPIMRANGTQVTNSKGEPAFFKTPGVNHNNLEIDFSSIKYSLKEIAELSIMYAEARPVRREAVAQTAVVSQPAIKEEVINDANNNDEPVHETLHEEPVVTETPATL